MPAPREAVDHLSRGTPFKAPPPSNFPAVVTDTKYELRPGSATLMKHHIDFPFLRAWQNRAGNTAADVMAEDTRPTQRALSALNKAAR